MFGQHMDFLAALRTRCWGGGWDLVELHAASGPALRAETERDREPVYEA